MKLKAFTKKKIEDIYFGRDKEFYPCNWVSNLERNKKTNFKVMAWMTVEKYGTNTRYRIPLYFKNYIEYYEGDPIFKDEIVHKVDIVGQKILWQSEEDLKEEASAFEEARKAYLLKNSYYKKIGQRLLRYDDLNEIMNYGIIKNTHPVKTNVIVDEPELKDEEVNDSTKNNTLVEKFDDNSNETINDNTKDEIIDSSIPNDLEPTRIMNIFEENIDESTIVINDDETNDDEVTSVLTFANDDTLVLKDLISDESFMPEEKVVNNIVKAKSKSKMRSFPVKKKTSRRRRKKRRR